MEKAIVIILEKLISKVRTPEIREDLEKHRKETIIHVKSVEDIFVLADIKREEMKTGVLEIMESELDNILKLIDPEAQDFIILESIAKTERMEISHYEALILSSKDIEIQNKKSVLDLLRANLAEEEIALSKAIISMKDQVTFWKRNIH